MDQTEIVKKSKHESRLVFNNLRNAVWRRVQEIGGVVDIQDEETSISVQYGKTKRLSLFVCHKYSPGVKFEDSENFVNMCYVGVRYRGPFKLFTDRFSGGGYYELGDGLEKVNELSGKIDEFFDKIKE